MKALLLNSGVGSRMGGLTAEKPKCMVALWDGETIIGRQLKLLADAGIQEAVITTGPFESLLKDHIRSLNLPIECRYVRNEQYRDTNYIYSMHLAANLLHDDILLFHGDMVFEPSVLSDLVHSSRSVVCVDKTLPLPEKDFKARFSGDRVLAIGVDLFGDDCAAAQPAYLFKKTEMIRWLDEISAFVARGDTKVYAENAFNASSGDIPIYGLSLDGRLCGEVDNEEDLITMTRRIGDLRP